MDKPTLAFRWRYRVAAAVHSPINHAFWGDKVTVVSAAFLAVVLVATVAAPFAAPHDPLRQNLIMRLQPPFSNTDQGVYLLGTDTLGRDLLSRIIYGGRISLAVGFSSVLISGALGVLLGLVAGYYKGLVDDVVMRAVDILMAIPLLFLALIVLYVLGPSFASVILVFAIGRWMLYCRITRGVVLSMRENAFIDSARALGAGDARILGRHILPNLLTPLLTVATMDVARVILIESTLSFLGMGIQPPQSTWGLMLAQGRQYMTTAWWVVATPGLAIFFTALSFNLVGVWVRAITDPMQRWRWLRIPKPQGA